MFFKKSCGLVLCSFSLMAQSQVWIGTSDSYSAASNWNPSGTPTVTSKLYFNRNSTYQPVLDGGSNYAKSLNFNLSTALSGNQSIFVNQIYVNAATDIGLGSNNYINLADFYQTDPLLVQLSDTLTVVYTTIRNELGQKSFSFVKSNTALTNPLLLLKGATIDIPSNNNPSFKPVVTFDRIKGNLSKDSTTNVPSRINAAIGFDNKVISSGATFEAPVAFEGNELFQWVDLTANSTTINLAQGNFLGPMQINGSGNNITMKNNLTLRGVGQKTMYQGSSSLTNSTINMTGSTLQILGSFNFRSSNFKGPKTLINVGNNTINKSSLIINKSKYNVGRIKIFKNSTLKVISSKKLRYSVDEEGSKDQIVLFNTNLPKEQKPIKIINFLKDNALKEEPVYYGAWVEGEAQGDIVLEFEDDSSFEAQPSDGVVVMYVTYGDVAIGDNVDVIIDPPEDNQIAKGFALIASTGGITGSFNPPTLDPWYAQNNYQLDNIGGKLLALVSSDISFYSLATTPNNKAVAGALDVLDNTSTPQAYGKTFNFTNSTSTTSTCLQEDILELVFLPQSTLNVVLDQLEPSEFKDQQIVMEEMIFNINDEASELLYTPHRGYRPFIFGGYNYLHQGSYSQYAGYRSRAGYEMAGFSYGTSKWQVLASLGALQTSTLYREVPSHSSSGSIIANVGSAGFSGRWSFGLDGLFSYDYLHTKRKIDFYNLKAYSSHNGLHLKGQFHGSYLKKYSDFSLKPYDDLAYLYGYEGSYTEYGAACLNLHLASSHRNMIRNTLGLRFELVHNEHVRPFIDASYVFEYRFNGRHYNAYFAGTSEDMRVQGLNPPKNMGKLLFGVTGSFGLWDYQLKVTAQAGHRFYDLGAAAYLDRRF